MADMIALRQLFTYRTDSATIPGYPRIQIDDQILLTEEVTGEGYLHYVTGISSTNDLETGAWKYELDTHWLGSDPEGEWAFDPDLSFAPTTRTYLAMQDSRLARYRS